MVVAVVVCVVVWIVVVVSTTVVVGGPGFGGFFAMPPDAVNASNKPAAPTQVNASAFRSTAPQPFSPEMYDRYVVFLQRGPRRFKAYREDAVKPLGRSAIWYAGSRSTREVSNGCQVPPQSVRTVRLEKSNA